MARRRQPTTIALAPFEVEAGSHQLRIVQQRVQRPRIDSADTYLTALANKHQPSFNAGATNQSMSIPSFHRVSLHVAHQHFPRADHLLHRVLHPFFTLRLNILL